MINTRELLATLMSLPLAALVCHWWLGCIHSERVWAWLNNALGGQNPGAASDIELILTFIAAWGLSAVLLTVTFKAVQRLRWFA